MAFGEITGDLMYAVRDHRCHRPPPHTIMAVSWGTLTPATIRVVQMDPGPMPTLTASAPSPR
jgi:hypothetical protein